jgi:hypothetical protein
VETPIGGGGEEEGAGVEAGEDHGDDGGGERGARRRRRGARLNQMWRESRGMVVLVWRDCGRLLCVVLVWGLRRDHDGRGVDVGVHRGDVEGLVVALE